MYVKIPLCSRDRMEYDAICLSGNYLTQITHSAKTTLIEGVFVIDYLEES